MLSSVNGNVALVWPPTGISLAALLLFGYWLWPGIALGAFLVTASTGTPLLVAFGIGIGNTLEALLGAYLLRRFVRFQNSLERLQDVLGLVTLAAVLSTTISATIGVASLCLGSVIPWITYSSIWRVWWLRNMISDLVIAPMLLIWSTRPYFKWQLQRIAEVGILMILLILVSHIVFVGWFDTENARYPLAYTPFPFIIWAVLRFGQHGAVTGTFVVSCIAIWGTIQGFGPFIRETLNENLMLLQGFIAVISITTSLVLAASLTERKRTEDSLRESEEQFRIMADTAPVMIWISNPDKLCNYFNKSWLEFTGRTLEQEMGNGWIEDLHPDDRQHYLDTYVTAFEARKDFRIEHRLRRVNGEYGWILNTGIPRFSSDGSFIGYIGSGVDITDRKQMEEQLHLLAAAIHSVGEGILITDAQLELPGPRIVFANEGLSRMSGYTPEELIGKTPRIFQGPKTDRAVRIRLKRELSEGKPFKGEAINYRKDGSEYQVDWHISPIWNSSGQITNYVSIQRDITQLKSLEEQFRQSQKMEAIGRLAGGIAHDFNNLLTVILIYSELLLKSLGDDNSLRKDVEEIKRAGEQATSLTRQLLVFSRRQTFQPKILSLNGIVADLEKMLRRLIGEDIDLIVTLSPDLEYIKADPGQMDQVIINLVINARDAMPQGGRLIIETVNIDLDEAYVNQHVNVQPGPYVMLAISDTGTGMDAETLSHIFEPFFTTKKESEGTGLGLATVYGIVKQSGGHIWVYSELGQGTTFKIYLPRIEEVDELAGQDQASTGSFQGSETILLVEDEDTVRNMVRRILLEKGYTVLEACHGDEALAICEQYKNPIHLMITDVIMPQMSGRELFQRLTLLYPKMKVLYISGYTDSVIIRHHVLNPATAFLQKPFTPNALAGKIREVLGPC